MKDKAQDSIFSACFELGKYILVPTRKVRGVPPEESSSLIFVGRLSDIAGEARAEVSVKT